SATKIHSRFGSPRLRVRCARESLFYPVRNPHLISAVIVGRPLEQHARIEGVYEEPVDPGLPRDPAALIGAIAVVGHLEATPAGAAKRGVPYVQEHEARWREPRIGGVSDRRDHFHRVSQPE